MTFIYKPEKVQQIQESPNYETSKFINKNYFKLFILLNQVMVLKDLYDKAFYNKL